MLTLGGAANAPGLAQQLLAEFGSIGATLAAGPFRLRRVIANEHAINAIIWFQATMICALRREVQRKPLLKSWDQLADYLHVDMGHATREAVRILYFDTRDRLIRDERLSDGTIDEAFIHVRTVMARALELGAASLLLVHNHPSGDSQPSRSDINLTKAMMAAGAKLDVGVKDHLIVSRTGFVSLRSMQLL